MNRISNHCHYDFEGHGQCSNNKETAYMMDRSQVVGIFLRMKKGSLVNYKIKIKY